MIIAVDFDKTIVQQGWPGIGMEVPYAIDTLKYLISLGHRIILHTCRTNLETDGHRPLDEAVNWCRERGITLWAVNDNPEARKMYGAQTKVSADLYIDDCGFGMPLYNDCVDWAFIKRVFKEAHETA